MMLERRAYTLRRGFAPEFWNLQHVWNRPEQIPRYIERNVGYFHNIAGQAEQIVHLQRYDDFSDWRERVASNQKPERAEYYSSARKLLTAQENAFFSPAPIDRLSPLWNSTRDWIPGKPCFDLAPDGNCIVVEETTDLFPGSVPAYWAKYREFSETGGFRGDNLIGCFSSMTGALHRVLEFRCFPTLDDARRETARLEADAGWREMRDAVQPLIRQNSTTILRPSPVPWMRALFTAA